MKKLLLATVVLMGMGASQVFADPATSDIWTTTVNLTTKAACKLSNAQVAVLTGTAQTANSGSAASIALTNAYDLTTLISDTDGLLKEPVTTTILFDEQSFCNTAHTFAFKSQFKGFASQNTATIGTGSDEFLNGIPHSNIVISGWEDGVDALAWTSGTVGAYVAAPADDAAWAALTTDGELNDTDVAAWHNDGDNGTLSSTTGHGLLFTITHTPSSATDTKPLIAGTYTDRFYLKIAQKS